MAKDYYEILVCRAMPLRMISKKHIGVWPGNTTRT